MFAVATEYNNRAIALSALHTEAALQSLGKQRFDILKSMGQAYDSLSDIDKKIFCDDMLQRKEFFTDAYKSIMDSFESVVSQNTCHNRKCEAKHEEIV